MNSPANYNNLLIIQTLNFSWLNSIYVFVRTDFNEQFLLDWNKNNLLN